MRAGPAFTFEFSGERHLTVLSRGLIGEVFDPLGSVRHQHYQLVRGLGDFACFVSEELLTTMKPPEHQNITIGSVGLRLLA